MEDLKPEIYETTFVEMIKQAFDDVPDKTALAYLGIDITFRMRCGDGGTKWGKDEDVFQRAAEGF